MARTGRPKSPLVRSDEERAILERWARRPKSAQALAQRSRIVLACAEGADNKTMAARERVSAAMVGKWRSRFVECRLDGLVDEADVASMSSMNGRARVKGGLGPSGGGAPDP